MALGEKLQTKHMKNESEEFSRHTHSIYLTYPVRQK